MWISDRPISSDTSFAMLIWAGGASTAATAEHRNLLRRSRLATEKVCTANRCYVSYADRATADRSETDQVCMTVTQTIRIQGDLPTKGVLQFPDVEACLLIWKVSSGDGKRSYRQR